MKIKKYSLITFSLIAILILIIVASRYEFKRELVKTYYELEFGDIQQISNEMQKEGRIIPLYELYQKGPPFFLQCFVSYFDRPSRNQASYWTSVSAEHNLKTGEYFFIPQKLFYELCCYKVAYDELNDIVTIYDKYNLKVNIKFKLKKE